VFTEEEVWATIKALPSDKAPGPDGYTGRFYKVAWEVIKPDLMAAVSRLMQGDVSRLFLLNSAYVTLLPKMADAMEVKDFRPISLMHSFAKIATKLLANRLTTKLPSLVSCNQSAFVKGRCILDNFMLVQETAKALNRQKEPRLLLKLDISKAFDSVSWPFVLEVLQHLGFKPIWCNVLAKLLRSSSTRVLANEEPGDLFCHRRGLQQGDPLSPMLFILVMDVLNSLITKASEQGLLQPLLRRGSGQRVSLYADDVVLFMQPRLEELGFVKETLRIFCIASGLVTNIRKSSVIPISCGDQDLERVQEALPCNLSQFPCKSLGLPLSTMKLPKRDMYPLIDRIADQLPGWKTAFIHTAGRAALIKSVLTAIPVYHLIARQCPKWVFKAIGKIQRGFLWKGSKDIRLSPTERRPETEIGSS
jgi:hypothetical protein